MSHGIVRAIFVSSLLFTSAFNFATAQRRGTRGAPVDELGQLVQRIESRYGRMRGLAADFEQVYRAPGMRERRERGRLFLQRPGRMRWEYDPQPGKLFIVNGREVWFYSPADREATLADRNGSSDARYPFLFLLGQQNLRREFRSIAFAEETVDEALRTLRLMPARAARELREISLTVRQSGEIVRLRFTDEAGASSEVTLSNISENFIAPPSAFEFRPPPGVNVRRQK